MSEATYPRSDDLWVNKIFPVVECLLEQKYLTLEMEDSDLIPKKGPVVFASNHAGWFTLDSLMFNFAVFHTSSIEQMPYAVVEDALFRVPIIKSFFPKLGVLPASGLLKDPIDLPEGVERFGIYPEGAAGNTKPFWKAYQMQPWKTGFLRLAHQLQAPIVPVAIVGGEECMPVAYQFNLLKKIIGAPIGVPLFPMPLPANWKIVFHAPVLLDSSKRLDPVFQREEAARIQAIVQKTLDAKTKGHIFPPRPNLKWANALIKTISRR